jgi:Homocysteine S-methyltransferase
MKTAAYRRRLEEIWARGGGVLDGGVGSDVERLGFPREDHRGGARRPVDEGATIVGGCRGTTPEHIAALGEAFR